MPDSRPPRMLVLLHGYQDEPSDLATAAALIDPHGRFELAIPRGPVETAQGPAWFDPTSQHAHEQLQAALDELDQQIDDWVVDHADASRRAVCVGGFSQGGSVALALALRRRTTPTLEREPVGGAFCLGGFLLPPDLVDYDFESAAELPVLLVHGSDDETVPVQNARSAARVLERGGVSVTFTEVETGHTLDDALLEPVRRWLDAF